MVISNPRLLPLEPDMSEIAIQRERIRQHTRMGQEMVRMGQDWFSKSWRLLFINGKRKWLISFLTSPIQVLWNLVEIRQAPNTIKYFIMSYNLKNNSNIIKGNFSIICFCFLAVVFQHRFLSQGFVHQRTDFHKSPNWNHKFEEHYGGHRVFDYHHLHSRLFHCGQGSSNN